ncbi:MAG: hypothetical protein H7A38_06415 [Chlamydiales bacterium]|nr:hypothetical protein [Chlamydiales bacterium]
MIEIGKLTQSIVKQSLKIGKLFSLIGMICKIHKCITFFQTSGQFLTDKLFSQEKISHVEKTTIKNLKEIQFELRPFFDGIDPTEDKIIEFIDRFNSRFWTRPIDKEGDLLASLKQRKLEMIYQGEQAYKGKADQAFRKATEHMPLGLCFYAADSIYREDPYLDQIHRYSVSREGMGDDLEYQQKMLECFNEWYVEITAPPSLPPSTVHYIASDYRTDSEHDA